MSQISISKTVYKVSDFLGWQRDGTLLLSPSFQRRPVWKPIAKSFLIDTIVRGFPVPVIYVRERVDLDKQHTIREVVDGQQRLRTILSFVDAAALKDFNPTRDEFTVRANHNSDIAGKPFARLSNEVKSSILSYEFSTHLLASDTDDRVILQMFSRINSTGTKLNSQELRNAEYFGSFKLLMYRLAVEQLDRWRSWKIFSEDQIARMKEVELTSDIVINMISGIAAKRQRALDKWYEDYDEALPGEVELAKRFERIFDDLDDSVGDVIGGTGFRSEVLFFSVAVVAYDLIYGLKSSLSSQRPKSLPASFRSNLLRVSSAIGKEEVPAKVLDAIRRAPVDAARRQIRHDFLRSQLVVPASK